MLSVFNMKFLKTKRKIPGLTVPQTCWSYNAKLKHKKKKDPWSYSATNLLVLQCQIKTQNKNTFLWSYIASAGDQPA